jgi:hypothetical protein
MTSIRNRRLRVPLLLLANGAAFAAADAIGGKGGTAVASAVLTIPVAAGADTDLVGVATRRVTS